MIFHDISMKSQLSTCIMFPHGKTSQTSHRICQKNGSQILKPTCLMLKLICPPGYILVSYSQSPETWVTRKLSSGPPSLLALEAVWCVGSSHPARVGKSVYGQETTSAVGGFSIFNKDVKLGPLGLQMHHWHEWREGSPSSNGPWCHLQVPFTGPVAQNTSGPSELFWKERCHDHLKAVSIDDALHEPTSWFEDQRRAAHRGIHII